MRAKILVASATALIAFSSVQAQSNTESVTAQADASTSNTSQNSGFSVPTIIDDRANFDAAYPHATAVSFDSAIGLSAPLHLHGANIIGGWFGGAQVVDSLIDRPATFWFGAQATSPNFLLTNMSIQIKFTRPITTVGFEMQCFGCDNPGQPTEFTIILLGASGEMVGSSMDFPANLIGPPAGTSAFLGVTADQPFQSIILQRAGNWMMQNLRYVPAPLRRQAEQPAEPEREDPSGS